MACSGAEKSMFWSNPTNITAGQETEHRARVMKSAGAFYTVVRGKRPLTKPSSDGPSRIGKRKSKEWEKIR